MTDQNNTAPAVWDPTARGGAGGWVRGPQQPGPQQPAQPRQPADAAPPAPQAPPARPMAPPPDPGGIGDQGPPLGARPYLAATPGHDAPTAPAFPSAAPPPPPVPPASPFPAHASAQAAAQAPGPYPGPGYQYPPRPGYPAQPDHPGGYEDLDDDEDRPTNRKAPLLIGFALLLVLAVGGGLLMAVKDDGQKDRAAPAATATDPGPSGNPQPAPAPSGSPADPSATPTDPASAGATPSPTATTAGPNAKAQAGALDDLLTQGESAKAPIGSAVAKVSSCPAKPDIADAAQVFDNGAKQRDELLRKLGALSASDVPGGADAIQSLKSAWQLSADIDRAYAAWARSVANQGCSGTAPTTADKKHADELNPQATQAKKDFVTKWKPIADAFGLTARTQDRI
ncbi:hypothetical protein PUR71_33485 [Streptomyces sp. SP17BM10]|uniref:hypothetical protein n=1 Tax=Streptomyces sp. SP17BM10 TaxID=3002530 RepID=UPI002E762EE4|nr:hypothetical protein [Streptomyces sp. SP17BM10]MEE1787785.1 hypothetical protein [Streptomyces sp. SP17BM10]